MSIPPRCSSQAPPRSPKSSTVSTDTRISTKAPAHDALQRATRTHAHIASLTPPRLIHTPGRALVMLRDGRKILGTLRSFDQFANLVLEHAVERVIVGAKFSDFPLGLYVIRAENLALLGTLVSSHLPRAPPTRASSSAAGTPSHPPTRPHARRRRRKTRARRLC